MLYYLDITYEGTKIGADVARVVTITIPMKLGAAANVLREGIRNRYTQSLLQSSAELQDIDPKTVKFKAAVLNRRFHPSLSEQDVIQKAKGYVIAESDYGGGALHIQRDDELFIFADDAAAAAAAEVDGVKLIKDLPLKPGDKDFAFYIDTPENRRKLGEYLAWERKIAWDGFDGNQMYIRIGNNEMDMETAIRLLAESMGIKEPITAIDVSIGRRVPAGKIEATMDYSKSASPSDGGYPAIDVLLRLADGSDPIQMVHVEQDAIEKKKPTTYLYHRGGDIVAKMEMPCITDDELAATLKKASICESELHICGGDPNYPLRVMRPECMNYTQIC